MLQASHQALWDRYDVAMLDLDGVVYIGPHAVPGAPERLAEASDAGMHLAYVTNNASRSPATVARHLREIGVDVDHSDVVTSAQAASRLLADRLPAGSPVFVIGGGGLDEALDEQGLRPVRHREPRPAAVVSGFYGDLRWATVITGAILVREGLPWVACNTDMTVPTPHGPGPGNGALVAVVARFAEREPLVAGKPRPPLFEETLRRVGGERPLVVGDRLDTDIEGANATGYDSLLVMTGVTGAAQLVAAPRELRPTYLAADLGGLGRCHEVPEIRDGAVACGDWTATVEQGRLHVAREAHGSHGSEASDRTDAWWRAVAVAGWRHLDTTGEVADASELRPPSSVVAEPADD